MTLDKEERLQVPNTSIMQSYEITISIMLAFSLELGLGKLRDQQMCHVLVQCAF